MRPSPWPEATASKKTVAGNISVSEAAKQVREMSRLNTFPCSLAEESREGQAAQEAAGAARAAAPGQPGEDEGK